MGFVTEISTALKSGFEEFKQFVTQKLQTNKKYLEQQFWVPTGLQMPVANYLIQQHQDKIDDSEPSSNLTEFVDFVLELTEDKNVGEPIHEAITAGKIQLAIHLLELDQNSFDMNRRDKYGKTLLSLALATKNERLLRIILDKKPNVNEPTLNKKDNILYQPLHEAIELDFALGVRLLADAGAQLDNPMGPLMDTPAQLAARYGKIKALGALLEYPVEQLNLEAENGECSQDSEHGDKSIELLCRVLARGKNKTNLINGIAMLLCRGAEPPRNEEMFQLIADNRVSLLKAIDRYLDSRPELVNSFVDRCHLSGSPLHTIIYVDNSWGNALRQLLGSPSKAAFEVEKWITRKCSRPSRESLLGAELSTKAATTLTGTESPLILYAEFVRRYEETYDNQRITNPWSTMRWMIAEGKGTWSEVLEYARKYPERRTGIVVKQMLGNMPTHEVHENLDASSTQSASVV